MTAPTLFDATCPTCGGSTEITLAFLKAKSGLMRCRQCLVIFDGFADGASLSPAVPSVNAPMAQRALVPVPVATSQSTVVEPVTTGASFASAAPVRALRRIRLPAPDEQSAVHGEVVNTDSAEHAALPLEVTPIGINPMAQKVLEVEVVPSSAPLTTVSEAPDRIEVRKRGLVPNRDANPAAEETPRVDLRALDMLVEQVVAEDIHVYASKLDLNENVVQPLIESMELSFGSTKKGEPGAEPEASILEQSPSESENLQISLLGASPVCGLAAEAADQGQLVALSDQFDLLFVNLDESCEVASTAHFPSCAPDPIILAEPVQRTAPPRARTPRLALLSSNDLPDVFPVDIEGSLAREILVPACKDTQAPELGLDEGNEDFVLRPKEVQSPAEQEVFIALESRRIEPRKIAPREIGRAPEVVAQRRESRAWAWGSSGSGPTTLDRARARLAPPVSWIKAEGTLRREILPNWSGWTLLAACVAGLAIQAARVESDMIYSRALWARTPLAVLCQIAGCKPGLAIAKEQLGLEAAQVRTDSEGRLVFTASLKNKAGYESLAPRLWISIEGEGGKSMASRTFSSAEWLGVSSVKASSEIEAKMVFTAPGTAAAGYKAELVLDSVR